jgi:transcriptional regulator with XRE-family HTH domain
MKPSIDFDDYLAAKLKNPEYRKAFLRQRMTLKLGDEIARLRNEAGLTQQELARRAGMLKQNVARVEKPDYSGYTLTTLQRIALALGHALEVRFVPRKVKREASGRHTRVQGLALRR